jgi:hypothetical protein
MKSKLISICVGGVVMLSISSCANVSTKPLTSGELRLLSISVPAKEAGDIKLDLPFKVQINFEAEGKPEIRTACFSFEDNGPYCYKVTDVNYDPPQTINVQVRAIKSGKQALEGYVYYIRDGKIQATNAVTCRIRILTINY